MITLWDVSTGREISRFMTDDHPAEFPILDVAFGPDDGAVLGSSVESLYLWDIVSGEILRQYTGHSGIPWSLDVPSVDQNSESRSSSPARASNARAMFTKACGLNAGAYIVIWQYFGMPPQYRLAYFIYTATPCQPEWAL